MVRADAGGYGVHRAYPAARPIPGPPPASAIHVGSSTVARYIFGHDRAGVRSGRAGDVTIPGNPRSTLQYPHNLDPGSGHVRPHRKHVGRSRLESFLRSIGIPLPSVG